MGQQVLVRKVLASNEGKSKKLLPTFSGPYINLQTLPHDRQIVEDLPGTHRSQKFYRGIVAVHKLKPYILDMEEDVLSETNDD